MDEEYTKAALMWGEELLDKLERIATTLERLLKISEMSL